MEINITTDCIAITRLDAKFAIPPRLMILLEDDAVEPKAVNLSLSSPRELDLRLFADPLILPVKHEKESGRDAGYTCGNLVKEPIVASGEIARERSSQVIPSRIN